MKMLINLLLLLAAFFNLTLALPSSLNNDLNVGDLDSNVTTRAVQQGNLCTVQIDLIEERPPNDKDRKLERRYADMITSIYQGGQQLKGAGYCGDIPIRLRMPIGGGRFVSNIFGPDGVKNTLYIALKHPTINNPDSELLDFGFSAADMEINVSWNDLDVSKPDGTACTSSNWKMDVSGKTWARIGSCQFKCRP
ncbi:hypothetical protein CC86DRAFT_463534 [Ophiobolus disseminans]|uniref:Uncharacterized protein n=1 Tax=Ophiobolus disseminans TaxID=1469910 RepID=A0A6A7AFN8_9PLEO|nr:hypothetical protein CC86DRAFT_463534 [Ophiobolus disseminans]